MRRLGLTLVLCIGAAGAGMAQLAPAGTGGVAALAGTLRQLGSNKRVLMVGAHPDDEDTQLLVLLSRGLGAQAAYLSLSRGEGGQNLIGPELGPELGVIRTEELLAARELDGARQFFTRGYDFGFSKSAEETFRFWPRDSILKDVVDVIRRFRPQVIIAVFSGTPADGHGQHQVSGMVARQAFDLLRDSTWGPQKLYRSTRFDTAATTVTLPVGTLDPVLGQSYFQVAMASRSRHRSQDMGQLQRPGPATARVALVSTRAPQTPETSLFAGVDTTLRSPGYAALIDSARAALTPWHPGATLPYLVRALRSLGAGAAEAEQRTLLERAIAMAAGVSIDGTADDGIVTPGERLQVEVNVWNAGDSTVRVDSLGIAAPNGWSLERLELGNPTVAPGTLLTRRFVLTVAREAERTQPYFLRRPLVNRGGLYDWSAAPTEVRGLPFEPPPVAARVRLTIAGEPVTLTREVVYRYRDQAIGEIRRPIFVTRDVDVAVAPEQLLWPIEEVSPRQVTITVTNRARRAAASAARVTVPAGWPPVPAESLSFTREDESKSIVVSLAPPMADALKPGSYDLRAGSGWLEIIDYPHIRPRALARPSVTRIRAARVALPGLTRVGYVRGAADRVPEALLAIGLPLELVGADSLARGDLSRYDAIVIGSRAYETEPALAANNGRLLEYGRNGGLIIVQYQQYPFVDGGFAPYPLTIARPHDRVTDETAPITPLDPSNQVFHYPNAIGPDDWRGWVQERGLYFPRTWDTTYVPALETHDPGPPGTELRGGLLIAPLGRGTYVYTGLSFFRQLPAGVPGAYRLFVNLLGLKRRNVP